MADDVSALAPDLIALWPDGPPDPIPGVGAERVFRMPTGGGGPETDWLRNVSRPTLTVVRPDPARANGTGVIVCPGGGGASWPGGTRGWTWPRGSPRAASPPLC